MMFGAVKKELQSVHLSYIQWLFSVQAYLRMALCLHSSKAVDDYRTYRSLEDGSGVLWNSFSRHHYTYMEKNSKLWFLLSSHCWNWLFKKVWKYYWWLSWKYTKKMRLGGYILRQIDQWALGLQLLFLKQIKLTPKSHSLSYIYCSW